ncbi:cysteine desulfurase family protein [Bacteriovoracaceae bacterium]|nr:cysteine desulfurase family protein [Bacteriovoracaceae bacterium]
MIYADYNGSAPICADVKEYLINRLETGPFANPNSIHQLGQKTLMGLENARAVSAKLLGCLPKNIIFNSGSTEGISHVFYSILTDAKEDQIIITSGIEHSAVVKVCKHWAHKRNLQLMIIPTLENGVIDLETLKGWVKEYGSRIATITVMAANNETGAIQPFKEISALCADDNIPFICDTTQIIGKEPFSFKESGADFAFLSGHKLGALTGSGLIMAKDVTKLKPLIIGGGQEKDLRGGTQNYLGNETIAVGLTYFQKMSEKLHNLREARDKFEARLLKSFPEAVVISKDAPRVASTTYISLPGIHGQAVQIELESQGIFVTTSSACSDNEPSTSKVLKSMGVTDDVGRGVVRISLGLCSPLEWYETIGDAMIAAYEKLSKIKSF